MGSAARNGLRLQRSCWRRWRLLQRTVFDVWQHDSINVPQEWKDAWLALILKPSQPGRHPSHYRPIGLTDPVGKTVLGMVKQQHEPELYAATLSFPHYAYIKHRGTAQAIARAFQHAHSARTLLAEQKMTLSNHKAGAKPAQLVGAVTVSIDLTKAFDSLEPAIMQRYATCPGSECTTPCGQTTHTPVAPRPTLPPAVRAAHG